MRLCRKIKIERNISLNFFREKNDTNLTRTQSIVPTMTCFDSDDKRINRSLQSCFTRAIKSLESKKFEDNAVVVQTWEDAWHLVENSEKIDISGVAELMMFLIKTAQKNDEKSYKEVNFSAKIQNSK